MSIINFINKFNKPTIKYFSVNVVDHCNLNCKYCDHFAPLAKKFFIDKNSLKKDLKRMSSLVNVYSIGLMGGEPLLHPDISEIVNITRNILPKSIINIFTNGILLTSQNEEFWKTCSKNKIMIAISRYDIKLDLKKIHYLAKKYKVAVSFYDGTANESKKMFKLAFDLNGEQDPVKMSGLCWQNKGSCSYLENGKFYKCSTTGHIHRLSQYFNLDLYPSDEDYVDIYNIKSGKQIIDYFNRVIPFCRYCNIPNQKTNLNFEISKKELSEWL